MNFNEIFDSTYEVISNIRRQSFSKFLEISQNIVVSCRELASRRLVHSSPSHRMALPYSDHIINSASYLPFSHFLLYFTIMGPKKASASGSSGEKRKKVMLSLELKQEIIEKHDNGVRVSDSFACL